MNELIMIVEDDDDLREAIALILEANGFRTVDAFDGLDALAKLEQGTKPSLIVLDLRMPRMNGAEFLHALQRTSAITIPVLAFTGDAGAAHEALAAGAVACLRKPVEPRLLVDAIRTQLEATVGEAPPP